MTYRLWRCFYKVIFQFLSLFSVCLGSPTTFSMLRLACFSSIKLVLSELLHESKVFKHLPLPKEAVGEIKRQALDINKQILFKFCREKKENKDSKKFNGWSPSGKHENKKEENKEKRSTNRSKEVQEVNWGVKCQIFNTEQICNPKFYPNKRSQPPRYVTKLWSLSVPH